MEEIIWRRTFKAELENRRIWDIWSFIIDSNFQAQQGWLQYSLGSFARFSCSICQRFWASSKVQILFHMQLKRQVGQVRMRIFKQKCKMCASAQYEEPTFTQENIEVAISCLVDRISLKFYDTSTSYLPRSFIKDGNQDGPHDSMNCEACAKGVCFTMIKHAREQASLPRSNLANRAVQVSTSSNSYRQAVAPQPPSVTYTSSATRQREAPRPALSYSVQTPTHRQTNPEASREWFCIIL